jgi:hypothetical protein
MAWLQNIDSNKIARLAIIAGLSTVGENLALAYGSISTTSRWSLLPRIILAPQAFLKPDRLEYLAPAEGKVIGVRSGLQADGVNPVAKNLWYVSLNASNETRVFLTDDL